MQVKKAKVESDAEHARIRSNLEVDIEELNKSLFAQTEAQLKQKVASLPRTLWSSHPVTVLLAGRIRANAASDAGVVR